MRSSATFGNDNLRDNSLARLFSSFSTVPRHFVIGIILILALVAFEMFNFDTTRYALESLLGDVRFAGFAWATILAIAFCAIDFAGLARLFTPEKGSEEPKEIWYLTGAWLLGATMNALMTWWAVSLTLLNHDLGNEVLSREDLLRTVPVFVAILVWLTRILFIGAVTAAGERILTVHLARNESASAKRVRDRTDLPTSPPKRESSRPTAKDQPMFQNDRPIPASSHSRVRQRPPIPMPKRNNHLGYNGMRTARRNNR